LDKQDINATLGVQGCSGDQIKQAYRKLALQYNGRKRTGVMEKFKAITEAYAILSDSAREASRIKHGEPEYTNATVKKNFPG